MSPEFMLPFVLGAGTLAVFALGALAGRASAQWARRREVARGWLAHADGVYRLTPINEEREAAERYADTLFAAGKATRRDEVRAWLGTGDFDEEVARAVMRNAGKPAPVAGARGRG